MLLFIHAAIISQSKSRHFTRGSQSMEIFGTSIVTFETEGQILKITLPQKNGHRIQTPSSKLMILVSSFWKKNCIRNNGHNLFILSLVFLEIIDSKGCILSGPPCIIYCPTLTKGSKWPITKIWDIDVFTLDLACSTSLLSFEQKHSSCWKIVKSRHDIALRSMSMTDTFCSFTRNFISGVASFRQSTAVYMYVHISSTGSQKGVITIQRCSIENHKGYNCHRLFTAIAPFWFSTEHRWILIAPFWFSTDYT